MLGWALNLDFAGAGVTTTSGGVTSVRQGEISGTFTKSWRRIGYFVVLVVLWL